MGVGGQRHAPAAFTTGKDPVPIVQEAGWAPGLVWMGSENLAPTGKICRVTQRIKMHHLHPSVDRSITIGWKLRKIFEPYCVMFV
jgi:hypothetical protein